MAERITHERAREIATKTGTIYWDGFETRELLDYIEQQERAASPPAIPPDSELMAIVEKLDKTIQIMTERGAKDWEAMHMQFSTAKKVAKALRARGSK